MEWRPGADTVIAARARGHVRLRDFSRTPWDRFLNGYYRTHPRGRSTHDLTGSLAVAYRYEQIGGVSKELGVSLVLTGLRLRVAALSNAGPKRISGTG